MSDLSLPVATGASFFPVVTKANAFSLKLKVEQVSADQSDGDRVMIDLTGFISVSVLGHSFVAHRDDSQDSTCAFEPHSTTKGVSGPTKVSSTYVQVLIQELLGEDTLTVTW